MQTYTVRVEKCVFGGQGLAHAEGKTMFIWGALPGEMVRVEAVRHKAGIIESVVVEVLEPSPDRVAPLEEHFLTCSPWQILSEEAENRHKVAVAREVYERIGKLSVPESVSLVSLPPAVGYRNKMEYSFGSDAEGKQSLAFHIRGSHRARAIPACVLADPKMTAAAEQVLAWVRQENVPLRSLKSLIVRSNAAGECIAGLFIKDRLPLQPPVFPGIKGFALYYSDHRSPASVPTELLLTTGDMIMTEKVCGVSFEYGLFSFFQVNVPIFERALSDISPHLASTQKVTDFYAGVGTIGLCTAPKGVPLLVVESNAEAAQFAERNVAKSGRREAAVREVPAEKALACIEDEGVLIVDPPRAGLHPSVVERLLEVFPEKIIYLSCDLSTQARDVGKFIARYRPVDWQLYNFFPRTPHIEGLIVLERL